MSLCSKVALSRRLVPGLALVLAVTALSCASSRKAVTYHDANMDFSLVQRVGVLPFANLTPITTAGDRVRDVFMTMLQATGSVYVMPPGEVQRALTRSRVVNVTQPTADEAMALGKELKVDALFTGVVREYGEVRSGNANGNAIAVSLQLVEVQSGKVVWSAASTKGGISFGARLLGGKGDPMNVVTEEAARDLLDKLYR